MSIRTVLIHTLLTLSLLTWLVGAAQAENTLLGTAAGASLTTGDDNTLLGYYAGSSITNGDGNTLVGSEAGQFTAGTFNTFFGYLAGQSTTNGDHNTYLGVAAGQENQTGFGNVFVGNEAGTFELGSNKLYIANSFNSFPLIYGEFDNHLVGINGTLGVGTQIPMDALHVRDGNLRIEQTGATHATLNFIANGKTWEIKNNEATGRLTFFSPGGGATTASFKFDSQAVENLLRVGVLAGNTVDINGNLMVTGTFSNPDYVFTPDYDLETIEDHAAYMWEHQHLPAVGPGQVNAQGQGMVNVAQRSQGMLEELEKAHIYIEQLNLKMTEKDDQVETLQAQVTALKEKEAELEKVKSEMAALKAMTHQLMSENRDAEHKKKS